MVANDLCIKAKARCGSVKQSGFKGYPFKNIFSGLLYSDCTTIWERSGSVVEWLTRDQGAAVSNLKGVTELCP